jgi:hypothetical protein
MIKKFLYIYNLFLCFLTDLPMLRKDEQNNILRNMSKVKTQVDYWCENGVKFTGNYRELRSDRRVIKPEKCQ